MVEGSGPYGPGTVQTGKEFKGLIIINSLKRGKEIIFTAPGAHRAQSPCGLWTMKIQPPRQVLPSKWWYCGGAVARLLIEPIAEPNYTTEDLTVSYFLFRMLTEQISYIWANWTSFMCYVPSYNRKTAIKKNKYFLRKLRFVYLQPLHMHICDRFTQCSYRF